MQSEIFYYKEGQWKNIDQNNIPKQDIQTLICFASRSLSESAFDHILKDLNAIGFFSYGEIACQYEQKNSSLYNQTISVTTISEL